MGQSSSKQFFVSTLKMMLTALKFITPKNLQPTSGTVEHICNFPEDPKSSKKEAVALTSDSESELSHEDQGELDEYNRENWDAFIVTKGKDKASPFLELKEMLTSISQRVEQLELLFPSGPKPQHFNTPSVVAGLDPIPIPPMPPPLVEAPLIPTAPVYSPLKFEKPVLSPLQMAVKHARDQGESLEGYSMIFPVFEDANRCRHYEPVPFKQLKELKQACAQYGPTAPFTLAIIESLGAQYLPPNDWKAITRACLSGGDYLLWRSEYGEVCGLIEDRNRRNGLQINFDMLMGEGVFRALDAQLNYPEQAYLQISEAALKAWKKLPVSNRKTEDLSKIRQGPDEPYQDFVARLLDAISKIIGDEEAGLIVTKQMAYENANAACQAALRPYRKKGNLTDYVRICADIGPSYLQGLSMAAAIQGKSIKEVLYQQARNKGNIKRSGPPGSCFSCGQMGHRMAQCPKRNNNPDSAKNPNVCPRCKKGKHWARDCRSKTDIEGKPLPPVSGNWVRGQPQAPKQCYGALKAESQPNLIDLVSKTSTEPPQAAQDWTCALPPTQY
ncbi:endogenous retrovirus group K member 10 Gag polyprotein-like [Odocoileus virginianus]|uniref:Endogenous retrovirus group K member 10 Gag polyprotein-like n=1 Tax=Odocoileus virginianus TaxID=9874 RepID=A0ABM4HYV1_ODOVR